MTSIEEQLVNELAERFNKGILKYDDLKIIFEDDKNVIDVILKAQKTYIESKRRLDPSENVYEPSKYELGYDASKDV